MNESLRRPRRKESTLHDRVTPSKGVHFTLEISSQEGAVYDFLLLPYNFSGIIMLKSKNLVLTMFLSLMVATGGSAWAADTILWRGWTDFGSCNRIKWYKDDIGIRWPTNESVGQTVTAEVYMARTVDEVIINRLKSCALKGVISAGSTALITSGASAWPAFKATFDVCLQNEGLVNFLADNISIRHESHCNW